MSQTRHSDRSQPRSIFELGDKYQDVAELISFVAKKRQRSSKIVFTNGCFDILHIGHVSLLQKARQQGDVLVVAVNSDDSVRQLKGPDRPIVPQGERVAMIAALEGVDAVTLLKSHNPVALTTSRWILKICQKLKLCGVMAARSS